MGKSKDVKTGSKASKAEAKPATKVATKEVAPSKKEKKSKKAPTPSESSESESESEESSSSSSESEEEAKPVKAAAKKEVTTSSESSDSSSSSDDDASSSGSDSDNDKSESSDSGSDSSDSSESEEETVPAKAVKAAKAVVNGAAKVVAKATESGSDSDSDSSESEAEEKAEKKSESGSDSSDSDSSDEEESTEESTEEAAPSKKRKADDDEEEVSAKKTKSEAVEDTGSKNLFVGNLSWNIDDEWLYREFEEFGEITGARVISDRDSGRSKGFGYVEFANSADAAKALAAKKGALIDGREANVDFSTPRDNAAPKDRANARAATYGDQKNPESDTLFVGNISFEANEDIIGEAFGAHGTVVNVRLPTDMDSGNPKGFGYVTFASVEDAKAAMENMMGADIAGRPVRLDYATPRPERDAGGGRGGGRGGRGGFGDRGGRGGRGGGRGGRGGFGDRGGRGGSRGGRGGSTNRGGFGDFQGKKQTF